MKLPRSAFVRYEPQADGNFGRDFMQRAWEELCKVVNGLISFGSEQGGEENIDGKWLSTTTPGVANTEFPLTHNLGRIPQGWLLVSTDKAVSLYEGGTAWTNELIYLKADVATATVRIFVI